MVVAPGPVTIAVRIDTCAERCGTKDERQRASEPFHVCDFSLLSVPAVRLPAQHCACITPRANEPRNPRTGGWAAQRRYRNVPASRTHAWHHPEGRTRKYPSPSIACSRAIATLAWVLTWCGNCQRGHCGHVSVADTPGGGACFSLALPSMPSRASPAIWSLCGGVRREPHCRCGAMLAGMLRHAEPFRKRPGPTLASVFGANGSHGDPAPVPRRVVSVGDAAVA